MEFFLLDLYTIWKDTLEAKGSTRIIMEKGVYDIIDNIKLVEQEYGIVLVHKIEELGKEIVPVTNRGLNEIMSCLEAEVDRITNNKYYDDILPYENDFITEYFRRMK